MTTTPTLNQIVFNIAENLGDTSEVLIARLKFTVLYYRAMMVRRDYSNNKYLPESILQELTVPIHKVDTYKDKILVSTYSPPVPIRIKGPVFHYVGGLDRKTPYRFMYPEQMEYHNLNKFSCKIPGYSYIDGNIILHNITANKILIRSVFENPMEVGRLAGKGCMSDDDAFPIPMDMLEAITKGILSGEMQVRAPQADVADEVKL